MDRPVISGFAWNELSNARQFTCPPMLNTNICVNEP